MIWFVSFAHRLGACLVEASSSKEAVTVAWLRHLVPAGTVEVMTMPLERFKDELSEARARMSLNRPLSEADISAIFGPIKVVSAREVRRAVAATYRKPRQGDATGRPDGAAGSEHSAQTGEA